MNVEAQHEMESNEKERSPDQGQGIQRMAKKQISNALIVTRLVISRKTAQTRSRKDL